MSRSAYPDAPTTPSDTIDRLTTPSSLLWHPRRCYGRSPFVIHFLQVYNPTMSVIQFFLAKLYGTRRGNNWHEGFQYKANGKTKLWSSESRGNKQIWRKFWHSSRYTNPYKYNRHTGKCGYVVRRCAIQKKIKSKDITEINVALPQTTTILFLPLFDNDQVQAAICTCLVCTLKLILHTHISQDVATAGPCSSRW